MKNGINSFPPLHVHFIQLVFLYHSPPVHSPVRPVKSFSSSPAVVIGFTGMSVLFSDAWISTIMVTFE